MRKWLSRLFIGIVIALVFSVGAMAATTTYQAQVSISTTGTAVALGSAQECDWIVIFAGNENSRPITVGSSTVTYTAAATDGPRLDPGQFIQLGAADRAEVYVNGTAGDYAYYVAASGTSSAGLEVVQDTQADLKATVYQGTAASLKVTPEQSTATSLHVEAEQATASELNATVVQSTATNLHVEAEQATASELNATIVPLGWSYSGEKGVATTAIKASAGMLHGVLIETDGTNNVTVQLYDHASTATNPITPAIVVAGGDLYGGMLGIDAICSNGIVLVLSGTNGVATVLYK